MTIPLFSTYKQAENIVTDTFLAVLQRLSLANIDRILGALLGDTDFSLVTFDNQPKGTQSVPDARISTGAAIWIETKIVSNAVKLPQLRNHRKAVNLKAGERLLLLTPDDDQPANLPEWVSWSNFDTLAGAAEDILSDGEEPPSEREAFLLREFIRMLRQRRLIATDESKVVVVAANQGWPMYQDLGIYRCKVDRPMRSLKATDYLGFYAGGKIQPLVPRFIDEVKKLDLRRDEEIQALTDPALKERVEGLREKVSELQQWHEFGDHFRIMFLSGPEDAETVKLEKPVVNDEKYKNGKTAPFALGTRYVTLESLQTAAKTSELEFL